MTNTERVPLPHGLVAHYYTAADLARQRGSQRQEQATRDKDKQP